MLYWVKSNLFGNNIKIIFSKIRMFLCFCITFLKFVLHILDARASNGMGKEMLSSSHNNNY